MQKKTVHVHLSATCQQHVSMHTSIWQITHPTCSPNLSCDHSFMIFHDVSCDPGVKSPLVIHILKLLSFKMFFCFNAGHLGELGEVMNAPTEAVRIGRKARKDAEWQAQKARKRSVLIVARPLRMQSER